MDGVVKAGDRSALVAVPDPVVTMPVEQPPEIEGVHHGVIEFLHPGAYEIFYTAAAYVAFAL